MLYLHKHVLFLQAEGAVEEGEEGKDETQTAAIVDQLSPREGSPPPGEGEVTDRTSPPIPGTPPGGK